MSLIGHVLQLFVSPLSDHRHSTAAVKYPSRLKVMEARFCFISPAGRCWLGLFWVSEQKTASLKLINAIGDERITSQTDWNQLSPYYGSADMPHLCLTTCDSVTVIPQSHRITCFPHSDTHLPFPHNWISIKMYHYEYSWHYCVRIHRHPGRL